MPGRTLVVTNDFPPRAGGIQAFVYNIVVRQPPDSVVVYAADWRGAASFDRMQPFPVVRHLRSVMLPEPAAIKTATGLIKAEGCDRVLFGASAPLGLMGPKLRQAGARRLVAITHGHEAGWAAIPGARSLLRRIGESTDVMTYLGEYTRARIAEALTPDAAARMRRLAPGVDSAQFCPERKEGGERVRRRYGLGGRPVIACVSRLMPRKGQDVLIRSLAVIRKAVPDAALLLVGGGPYRRRLEHTVSRLGLGTSVVMTGSVPWSELPDHYAAGDVFAMPCRTRRLGTEVEGLGIVYLEASATGLPVVAGSSGGAPDAVLAAQTGFVVDGRSIEEVAAVVGDLLVDRALRDQLGARGRAWVESDWTWDVSASRLTDLLEGRDPDIRD